MNVVDILLIEDNPSDASVIGDVLGRFPVLNRVHHVKDGEEAMSFLCRQGPHEDAPSPDLILLDATLSGISAYKILNHIKGTPGLHLIPTIVLGYNSDSKTVLNSYIAHGNCFILKPENPDALATAIERVARFWLKVATLPTD